MRFAQFSDTLCLPLDTENSSLVETSETEMQLTAPFFRRDFPVFTVLENIVVHISTFLGSSILTAVKILAHISGLFGSSIINICEHFKVSEGRPL